MIHQALSAEWFHRTGLPAKADTCFLLLQVRAGFFDVVSTLCSKCPSVVQEFGDQICPAVLYLLDETEPAPITSLWQAMLHVIITVPVCVLCLNLVTSCQARKLNKGDAMDRCKWRKVIKEARWSGLVWVGECFFWYQPTRVVPDQRPLNGRCCCCCCLISVINTTKMRWQAVPGVWRGKPETTLAKQH